MALIDRIRGRARVWEWRVRYWWLDTESGEHAQAAALCLAVLVLVLQVVRVTTAALQPAPAVTQERAVYWWVVQIILALVSAAVSYLLRPKVQSQPDPKQESPTVEDGLCVDDDFGEVWKDDPPVLAWKVVRTEKIKSKSKK